jgi:hypothetical protein
MTTDVAVLEQEATGLTQAAADIQVVDAGSFERASEFLKGVALYIRRVGEVLDPIVEAAHQAHKVAVRQREMLLGPAKSVKLVLGQRMAAWEQEQTRLRREAEERARQARERQEREARERAAAEQRRLQQAAETKRLDEAAALEAKGDAVGAERLLAQPMPAQIVNVTPVFTPQPMVAAPPKLEGVSFSDGWKAEVTDLGALIAAVAAGQQPATLLLPNQVALNQLARAMKRSLNVPGVTVVEVRRPSVR